MIQFNPTLHGLRGLAALGVLLFHWAQPFPVHRELHALTEPFGLLWHASLFIGFGWIGVPLFFVLSGYLLTAQLLDGNLSLNRTLGFFKRRFLRIYPATWAQFGILVLLTPFLAGLPKIADHDTEILSNILLYVNLPPNFAQPVNPVWWTLPIELTFYLLLPMLTVLAKKTHWAWLFVSGFAITLAWRWGVISIMDLPYYGNEQEILNAVPGSLSYFMAGYAVAYLSPQHTRPVSRYAALFALGLIFYSALVFLAFRLEAFWQGNWMLIVWPLFSAVVIGCLLWVLLEPLEGFGFLASRPLVWLGEVSFGIYLWHFPVLEVLAAYWPTAWRGLWYSSLALCICLVVTLGLAFVSFALIERPAMGWGRRKF